MRKLLLFVLTVFVLTSLCWTFAGAADLDALKNRYKASYQNYLNALKSGADEETTQELLERCVSDFNEYKKAAESSGEKVTETAPVSAVTPETAPADEVESLKGIIAVSKDPDEADRARMILADIYMKKGMAAEAKALYSQVAARGGAQSKKAGELLKLFGGAAAPASGASQTSFAAPSNNEAPGGFFSGIASFFNNIFKAVFGGKNTPPAAANNDAPAKSVPVNAIPPAPATPEPPEPEKKPEPRPDNFAAPITVRVLVLNFDPIVSDTNPIRLHQAMGCYDPRGLADQCVADLSEISHGIADYRIVEWIDVETLVPFKKECFKPQDGIDVSNFSNEDDYFPSYKDADQYLLTLSAARDDEDKGLGNRWASLRWHGNLPAAQSAVSPGRADFNGANYKAIFKKFGIAGKIDGGQIDELWIFAPHMSGLNESKMAGPSPFFINGEAIPGVAVKRNFAIMGYNFAYPVGNMLEDYGHRMECTMDRVFSSARTRRINELAADKNRVQFDYNKLNLWERFVLVDIVMPGRSGVGTMHFAPNSKRDYEWQSSAVVETYYPDWLNYPNFKGEKVSTDCAGWVGAAIGTDGSKFFEGEREHHKWWFRHIPHLKGTVKDVDGAEYLNNWWSYMLRNSTKNK